jgi:hypothetical protein
MPDICERIGIATLNRTPDLDPEHFRLVHLSVEELDDPAQLGGDASARKISQMRPAWRFVLTSCQKSSALEAARH